MRRKLHVSLLAWEIAGFVSAYIFFFIIPVFLSGATMLSSEPLPRMTPIGADLRETVTFVQEFLIGGGTPYIGTATYPPLSYLLLGPLLWVAPAQRYFLFTCLTLASFGLATLWFPVRAGGLRRATPEVVLVFATGLLSYGFLFELERGQFNVVAALLVYLAVWLFHKRSRADIPAYVLLTLSVQLKLYPLAFVLMFIRSGEDWRRNVGRVALLLIANVALFFALGWKVFLDFVTAIQEAGLRMQVIAVVNHSAFSFVGLAAQILEDAGSPWSQGHRALLHAELLAILVLCLAIIMIRTWHHQTPPVNPYLVLACVVTALIVPSVSNDYTLAILPGPVGLLLAHIGLLDLSKGPRTRVGIAAGIFCLAYGSVLIPPSLKPGEPWLQNALPALVVMLIATTFIAVCTSAYHHEDSK